jgi:hypothetical protein
MGAVYQLRLFVADVCGGARIAGLTVRLRPEPVALWLRYPTDVTYAVEVAQDGARTGVLEVRTGPVLVVVRTRPGGAQKKSDGGR